MLHKCVRKLILRWILLGLALAELATVILRPHQISLWLLNSVVSIVPLAILAWVVFDGDAISYRWAYRKTPYSLHTALVWGAIFGVVSFPVALHGLGNMVVLTAVVSLCIMLFNLFECGGVAWGETPWGATWRSFTVELVAVNVAWSLTTISMGVTHGLLFAGAMLATAAVFHFALFGLGSAVVWMSVMFWRLFSRIMLPNNHSQCTADA